MNDSLLRLLDPTQDESESNGCWRPPADVYRAQGGWLVKLDLAGISPQEIQLHRRGRRLTVQGMRRDALVQQGLCSYSLEINYNRFERWIELPSNIDQCEMITEYRDGMLLIWLQHMEQAFATKDSPSTGTRRRSAGTPDDGLGQQTRKRGTHE